MMKLVGTRSLDHSRPFVLRECGLGEDRDAISARDTEQSQHVRELADLAIEIEVCERTAVARLAFPDERGLGAIGDPELLERVSRNELGVLQNSEVPFEA